MFSFKFKILDNLLILFLILYGFFQIFFVLYDFEIFYSRFFYLITFFISILILIKYFYYNKLIITNSQLYLYVIISLLFLIVLCQNVFLENMPDNTGRLSLEYSLSYALGIISWLIIGAGFSTLKNRQQKVNVSFLILSFLILSFLFVWKEGFFLNYSVLATGRGYDFFLSHLSIGPFIIYIIALIFAYLKKFNIFYFILIMLIYISIGGRADLFAFLITSLIYWYMYFDLKRNELIKILSIIPALVIVVVFKGVYFSNERYSNLSHITSDSSFQSRIDLFISSLQNLPYQFFIGNPNLVIRKDLFNDGSLGGASHNILSIFEFYGFFLFLLVVFYLILTTLKLKIHYYKITDPIGRFGVFLFIFTTLSIILFKSFSYYPFWFCMGFWLFYNWSNINSVNVNE